MTYKHLVCIVEGKGEVKAVPRLCHRILYLLKVEGWHVQPSPIRHSRSRMVDERLPSPRRPCHKERLENILGQARAREHVGAVLILCDADDDCAGVWGPSARTLAGRVLKKYPSAAVMAEPEYEAWLLAGLVEEDNRWAAIAKKRDAKKVIRREVPDYKPTTHQSLLTEQMDLSRAWARSDSFDKLVRSLAELCGAKLPRRPGSPRA